MVRSKTTADPHWSYLLLEPQMFCYHRKNQLQMTPTLTLIPSTSLLFNHASQLTSSRKSSLTTILITTSYTPQHIYTQSTQRWVVLLPLVALCLYWSLFATETVSSLGASSSFLFQTSALVQGSFCMQWRWERVEIPETLKIFNIKYKHVAKSHLHFPS